MYSEPFHNDTNIINCNLKLLFTNGNHVQFGYTSLLYHLLSDVITCTMLSEKYFVIIITRL